MSKSKHLPHNKQTPAAKLNQRIAEEAQLLAEEKWIIEALKKIKVQKNGLQIERLHLESMRTKLLDNVNPRQTNEVPIPVTEAVNADKEVSDAAVPTPNVEEINTCSIQNTELNNQRLINYELCNAEELNLSITNSIFDSALNAPCDEEEDEEDMENCLLDMDLLMSGK